jgi:hypothetical protein
MNEAMADTILVRCCWQRSSHVRESYAAKLVTGLGKEGGVSVAV